MHDDMLDFCIITKVKMGACSLTTVDVQAWAVDSLKDLLASIANSSHGTFLKAANYSIEWTIGSRQPLRSRISGRRV